MFLHKLTCKIINKPHFTKGRRGESHSLGRNILFQGREYNNKGRLLSNTSRLLPNKGRLLPNKGPLFQLDAASHPFH